MKFKIIAVSLATLVVIPLTAHAQAPELLIPVTGSEEAIVRAMNEYYLKKEMYFAKRYRIVRVNTNLLVQGNKPNEQINANLFDDVTLTYDVTEGKLLPGGHSIRFEARLTNPPTSVKKIMETSSGLSQSAAESIHHSMFGLSLSGVQFVHDEKTDRFWPVGVFNQWAAGRPVASSKPKKLNPRHETLFAVATEFNDPDSTAKYYLQWLDADPRYHVVWEIDFSKKFAKPDDPGDEIPWPTEEMKRENEAKRLAYEEFRLSLGDDPRQATEHRDLNAYRDSLEGKSSEAEIGKEGTQ